MQQSECWQDPVVKLLQVTSLHHLWNLSFLVKDPLHKESIERGSNRSPLTSLRLAQTKIPKPLAILEVKPGSIKRVKVCLLRGVKAFLILWCWIPDVFFNDSIICRLLAGLQNGSVSQIFRKPPVIPTGGDTKSEAVGLIRFPLSEHPKASKEMNNIDIRIVFIQPWFNKNFINTRFNIYPCGIIKGKETGSFGQLPGRNEKILTCLMR